jgi:tRNA-specific 2-thiouridylase
MKERVVVAMSGGVDSSLAAALLVEQGYDAVGVMLRLWAEDDASGAAGNRCCTPDAQALARHVANMLEIPFYVLDVQTPFKAHIVDFFVQEYSAGVTPNPCLQCNRHIRFGHLLHHALALDAQFLATGHYARVRQVDGRYQLLKGVDERKDQAYVLHVLTQEQLAHALFPVGGYTKPEVRDMARERGLPVATRSDSQDLCFLADNNYRRFLADHAPEVVQPGPILDTAGRVLGEHQGLPFYTIGQRKGIGVTGPEPLYVVATDPAANALVVGTCAELGHDRFVAQRLNWISGVPPVEPFRCTVKIRYKASEVPATVTPLEDARVDVVTDEALRDVTPGQAAVFYDGEVVLGGGIISATPGQPAPR